MKIKTTWNIIKNETGKMHLPEQSLSLLINNKNVMDPKIDANVSNSLTVARNTTHIKEEEIMHNHP
jgi:hypothetical protein